jgi:hypothetical protein
MARKWLGAKQVAYRATLCPLFYSQSAFNAYYGNWRQYVSGRSFALVKIGAE